MHTRHYFQRSLRLFKADVWTWKSLRGNLLIIIKIKLNFKVVHQSLESVFSKTSYRKITVTANMLNKCNTEISSYKVLDNWLHTILSHFFSDVYITKVINIIPNKFKMNFRVILWIIYSTDSLLFAGNKFAVQNIGSSNTDKVNIVIDILRSIPEREKLL